MPIEFNCIQCSSLLRVPEEHAGKQAKCPSCSSINSIPTGRASTESVPDQPAVPINDPGPASYTPPVSTPPVNNPYSTPRNDPAGVPFNPVGNPNLQQERGGLILTLGLVSLFCGCFILGILAWVLGASDLKKMRNGTMDPSGEGLTRAGMIIGIVATVLSCLGIGLNAFVTLMMIAEG